MKTNCSVCNKFKNSTNIKNHQICNTCKSSFYYWIKILLNSLSNFLPLNKNWKFWAEKTWDYLNSKTHCKKSRDFQASLSNCCRFCVFRETLFILKVFPKVAKSHQDEMVYGLNVYLSRNFKNIAGYLENKKVKIRENQNINNQVQIMKSNNFIEPSRNINNICLKISHSKEAYSVFKNNVSMETIFSFPELNANEVNNYNNLQD